MPAGVHYAEVSQGPGVTAKSENRTSNPARCGEQHMTPTWYRCSLGKPATRAVCQCPSGRRKAVGYGGSLPYQPRADRLDVRSLTQGYQRPIGRVVGDHGAKVHRLIDELDSGLDPAIRVQPNHEPGLIVERPVLPGKRHFHREIADDRAVREMAVVANEAIFRLAPEIRPVVGGDDQVAAEAPPMRRRIQPREGVSHTTDTTRSRSPVPDPKQMLRCALAARSLDI